jgi:TonB family protein
VLALVVVGVGGWGVYRFIQRVNPPRDRPSPELVDYQEVADTTAPPLPDAPSGGPVAPSGAYPDYVDSAGGEATLPPDDGTYELSVVDEIPDLLNRDEISESMSHNYPPLLRDAGVTGSVTLRMRVTRTGTVDPASVTVESTSDEMFSESAVRVVKQMRFRPAKLKGQAVPVWVTLPVTFQLER